MRRASLAALWLLAAVGSTGFQPVTAAETDPAARFNALKPGLLSKDKAERQKACDAYLAEGPEGRAQLAKELLATRAAAAAACREPYLSDDTQKKLLSAHKKLSEARAEALRVIFDKKIYPDANHGRVGQPIVDKAVAAVKAIYPLYRAGFDPVVRRFERVPRAYERIKEIDPILERLEVKDVELNPPLEKVVNSTLQPELLRIILEVAEYHALCERVLRYNRLIRTTASAAERRLVDVTNEYRMQLGLKPLAISEPLTQAARKHSHEMQRLGYFGHDSPTAANRSPGQRCANEGYTHYRGENCASAGSADGAFVMWYNSSGHHRNMLGATHNEIGVGLGGPWTEDFGSRPDLDLDNPPRSLPAAKK